MELRKRQAKILQDLFEKKRISVDAILDEYGISKRTLYYDLNKNGKIESFEYGAFLVANSWGNNRDNDGFIWVMYDALNQVSNAANCNMEGREPAFENYNYFFINFIPEEGEPFKLLKKGDVWFTAVMLRGFIELYQTDHNKTYINSFNQNMDYAWEHVRDEKGLFDIDFSGRTHDDRKWLLTQAAMVEMYARLAVTK